MKTVQYIIGFVLLVLVLILGRTLLVSDILFFRLLVGIGFGYALTRGAMGFAGSINRAYGTGSTKLMRVLMLMFTATALASIAFLYGGTEGYDLWVNPINFGVILGGIFFGFGMTFSMCCASGVLTDLVTSLPRALITLLFFGIGVFIGFPLQSSQSWITHSWTTSATGKTFYGGVYLPDLFKWDGLNGYLGAGLLTVLLAAIVVFVSYRYENSRKLKGSFTGVDSEFEQLKAEAYDKEKTFNAISSEGYKRMFVKPWRMETAAAVITGLFIVLMGVTKAGWGASTPYGFWFGRLLRVFGVSAEALAEFSGKPVKVYTMPFFEHPINVQNFGIILGTLICLLLAGKFITSFRSQLKISAKGAALYAAGGLLMGLGTRFANGCNVGALYTPIANFSLAGWVFLLFLVVGGILGNMVAERVR